MYVRLAFAVAAHLDPEILIVDEVLAVGDADFQNKCLGKMQDVTNKDGRTVLFVSHNIASIKSLCSKGILLKNGTLQSIGAISSVIENYQIGNVLNETGDRGELNTTNKTYFTKWKLEKLSNFVAVSRDTVDFVFYLTNKENLFNVELGFLIRDTNGEIIYGVNTKDNCANFSLEEGEFCFRFSVRLPISPGKYQVDIAIASNGQIVDHWLSNTKFQIISDGSSHLPVQWTGILNENFHFEFGKQ